jgi:hypothetical protein
MGGPGRNSVEIEYNYTNDLPSVAIVRTLAKMHETEPEQVDITLANHIDPDALDQVLLGTGDAILSFSLQDHQVQIDDSMVAIMESENEMGD